MGTIPKKVQELVKTAFPMNVCLIGSVLPNGYAQMTPRGSAWPYDDDHIMLWERGSGSTHGHMKDGEKLTTRSRRRAIRWRIRRRSSRR